MIMSTQTEQPETTATGETNEDGGDNSTAAESAGTEDAGSVEPTPPGGNMTDNASDVPE